MKVFLDRLADSIHCQRFTGKYGFSVSTAGGSNSGLVADYLNATLQNLGANTVGKISVDIGPNPDGLQTAKAEAFHMGEMLIDAIDKKETWPEQEAVHSEMKERMKYIVTLNKDEWQHEYKYWKKQGWL